MLDFTVFAMPETYVSLFTLTLLEVVLGIDNIVFITILAGKLPDEEQSKARKLGLAVALLSRVALLFAISWLLQLEDPWFSVMHWTFSGKDIILLFGGLFLMGKAVHEIYGNVEKPHEHLPEAMDASGALDEMQPSYASFVVQVVLLDMVFSLDSVITAAGVAEHLAVMVVAVLVAVIIMMIFADPIGDFVQKHASVRVLALAFLVLIGFLLVVEAFGQHVSKGYVYFAMIFALGMELLNMRMRSRRAKLLTRSGRYRPAVEKRERDRSKDDGSESGEDARETSAQPSEAS